MGEPFYADLTWKLKACFHFKLLAVLDSQKTRDGLFCLTPSGSKGGGPGLSVLEFGETVLSAQLKGFPLERV